MRVMLVGRGGNDTTGGAAIFAFPAVVVVGDGSVFVLVAAAVGNTRLLFCIAEVAATTAGGWEVDDVVTGFGGGNATSDGFGAVGSVSAVRATLLSD